MFVVLMHYEKELQVVDTHLQAHREHLEQGYQRNYLLASGPQNPRTGGVMLSQLKEKTTLEAFLKADPFVKRGIASYQIIEFTPVKYHQAIKALV